MSCVHSATYCLYTYCLACDWLPVLHYSLRAMQGCTTLCHSTCIHFNRCYTACIGCIFCTYHKSLFHLKLMHHLYLHKNIVVKFARAHTSLSNFLDAAAPVALAAVVYDMHSANWWLDQDFYSSQQIFFDIYHYHGSAPDFSSGWCTGT